MALDTVSILSLPVALDVTGVEWGVIVQGGVTKRFQLGLIMEEGSSGSVEDANTVLAGPTTGSAAVPSFRALVDADIPSPLTIPGAISGASFNPTGSTAPDNGIYLPSANVIGLGGSSTTALRLPSAASFGWSTDLTLYRDAANVLALRNGTTGQAFNVYNTYANSGTDYETGIVQWVGNALLIGTAKGGTGSARQMYIGTNITGSPDETLNIKGTIIDFYTSSGGTWRFNGAGFFPLVNNTSDLGSTPNNKVRTGYFGTAVVSPILTITQGTITTDASQINGSVTWNDSSIVGPAWKLNVTATSANAAALLMDLQVASSSKFKVDRTGLTTAASLALGGATIGSNALAVTGTINGSVQIQSGTLSSALTTLTGASDGFRANSSNVTQFAAEGTTSSSSTAGALIGLYSNDGAAMASGDRLGGVRAGGSSSASALRNSAVIAAFADEAWADGAAYGSRWEFQTTTNGATSATTKLLLDNAGVLRPNANDGATLGSATVSFSDLFLASGGVINWANGDVTITHSSNALAFAGASTNYTFDAIIIVPSGVIDSNVPTTQTNDFTAVGGSFKYYIANKAGTITVTLPSASSFQGWSMTIKTIQNQTVVSNASNVIPLIGGSAGTAILSGTQGKWATLVSNGTNWEIMAAN